MPPHNPTGNPVHSMFAQLNESGCIPIDLPDEHGGMWAMPSARAGREPSHVSLSRPFGLPSHIAAFRDDWLSFIADVRAAPYSHALVALAGLLAGLLLIIVPALIGAGLA